MKNENVHLRMYSPVSVKKSIFVKLIQIFIKEIDDAKCMIAYIETYVDRF